MNIILILVLFAAIANCFPIPGNHDLRGAHRYIRSAEESSDKTSSSPVVVSDSRPVRASPAPGPLKSKDDLDGANTFGFGYYGLGYGLGYGYPSYGGYYGSTLGLGGLGLYGGYPYSYYG